MMKKNKDIILIGGGGHARVIMDAILSGGVFKIKGIVDPAMGKGTMVAGYKVLGGDEILGEIFSSGVRNAIVAVGSVKPSELRKKLYEKARKIGFNFPVVIHPSAVIARDVLIEEGTFVAPSATVNTGSRIGKNAIINTSSSIDHDCSIGDFVHIAPGVVLSGEVCVGSGTHVGTGAVVVNDIRIGENCFISAGHRVSVDLREGMKHSMTFRMKGK